MFVHESLVDRTRGILSTELLGHRIWRDFYRPANKISGVDKIGSLKTYEVGFIGIEHIGEDEGPHSLDIENVREIGMMSMESYSYEEPILQGIANCNCLDSQSRSRCFGQDSESSSSNRNADFLSEFVKLVEVQNLLVCEAVKYDQGTRSPEWPRGAVRSKTSSDHQNRSQQKQSIKLSISSSKTIDDKPWADVSKERNHLLDDLKNETFIRRVNGFVVVGWVSTHKVCRDISRILKSE